MAKTFCRSSLAALAILTAAGAASADEPFSGTWSPSCKPAAGKEVDNSLATIVFFKGAVKFADVQCEIAGWQKKKAAYLSPISCFKKNEPAIEGRIVVVPVEDKLKIAVSGVTYRQTVERCGN